MGQAVAPPAPLECPLTVSQTPEDDSADPRLSRPDGSALSPHRVPSPLAPALRTCSAHPLPAPALRTRSAHLLYFHVFLRRCKCLRSGDCVSGHEGLRPPR